MNIVFRCDASIQIGTGHVMRCLTLADELSKNGAKCHFICREHDGNLIEFIGQKNYTTYTLPSVVKETVNNVSDCNLFHYHWLGDSQENDALLTKAIVESLLPEWLIVDHYALDETWETKLRAYCDKILVIDDLADRYHNCDILLDQTYGRSKTDYADLTSNNCRILCGSKYALLRPDFAKWRQYSLRRRQTGELNHLLINLGGVDKDNITSDILDSLKQAQLPKSLKITVVMGSTAPWIETVKRKATELPWCTEVKSGVSNMAELMANSDLAIGAAGSTTWERCCLGLPTIMLAIADNQINIANNLESINAVKIVLNDHNLKTTINEYISIFTGNIESLRLMSQSSSNILDGKGVMRIINYMSEMP